MDSLSVVAENPNTPCSVGSLGCVLVLLGYCHFLSLGYLSLSPGQCPASPARCVSQQHFLEMNESFVHLGSMAFIKCLSRCTSPCLKGSASPPPLDLPWMKINQMVSFSQYKCPNFKFKPIYFSRIICGHFNSGMT